MNSVTQFVGAISAAVLLSTCCPSVMWLTAQYSGWGQREMGLLAGSCIAQENRCSLHAFTFPREESQVEKGCLGTELCHLVGGSNVHKVKLLLLPSPVRPVAGFARGIPELPHWALGLFKGFFSHVWPSKSVLSKGSWTSLTGTILIHGPLEFKAMTAVFTPTTWVTCGKDSSWILWPSCSRSHSTHKVTFVRGSIPNYCCWKGRLWRGCVIGPSCLHHSL